MAEAALNFVVVKLANIIEKEMQLFGGVRKKVERMQRELIRIKCCLRDADSKRKGDARVQNWLNELRDVAYRIEDAIDAFFLEVEDHSKKDPSFLQKLKNLCNKPPDVPILHKLDIELNDIQNELEEISKSRIDYGIELLQDKGKGEAIVLPFRRSVYEEVDETEVIGLHKNNILKLLCLEETPRRAVITIVGTGGLGKTTLAHRAYRSARTEFKYHIMLSISQKFSLIDLLKKMLHKCTRYVRETQDVGDLISELKGFLRRERYLIILDDVWRFDLWNQLKDVLPDVKNGSRILMTTRFMDVAKSADPQMKPYELKFLNDKESLDLLLKNALPYQETHEECPSDLLEIAKKLSKKCKGLPLALVVVGGILSTKEQSYHGWQRVLRTMDWHSEGKDCMHVLAMSYQDMPYYLKACFLYLASFPDDYEISAKRLIRMWVAEEFIPHESRKTMEEMAENCLEELFQRSMIIVSSRCMNGSIKCFQLHDLLRDLAMHEARKENFVTVFSQDSDVNQPKRGIRRASLQSCNSQFMEYVGPNTRSLLLFRMPIPKCSNIRLLKVLELVGVAFTNDLVSGLNELIYLKYLAFRNCLIPISSCSFCRMKTLETLDIRGTRVPQVNSFWTISTLTHVLYDGLLNGPISTTDLRNLQTMRWVSAHRKWLKELPLLNNMRTLGLHYKFGDWVTVTNVFGTLPSLFSLGIKGYSLPMEIVYPKALPNYQNLQTLYLGGKWSETVTLEASLFPPHLVKLTLMNPKLEQNPMPELGKLKSLKKLCLKGHVLIYTYSGPTICPQGFPVLQYLNLIDSNIKDLTVAQGVMPKLTYISRGSSKVHLPPELQHVILDDKFLSEEEERRRSKRRKYLSWA